MAGDHDRRESREPIGAPADVAVAIRAGAALFNEGFVLGAHDPWETAWLPLDADDGGDDEPLLHGLIAAAAATHHATDRNWTGAVGCAENAVGYLTPLGSACRGVALDPVRDWCRRLASDPETIERRKRPEIRVDGSAIGFTDLGRAATAIAAPVVAVETTQSDEETLSTAADLARAEAGTGRTRVTTLLFGFLRQPDARPQIAARIADHVDRAERRRRDVDDLFE